MEVNKIEEIIRKNLMDETGRCTIELRELIARKTEQAVERINEVYTSAITALKTLELKDATIYDFFERTQGNIRVIEETTDQSYYERNLGCSIEGRDILSKNPIRLAPRKKYKIIVMAMEEK